MSTTHSELNSFISKFCQLWRAGVTANFHAETHAGMAWCQVRVQLGPAPAPADRRPQAQGRRRGPAHQRRKERRAAARFAAAAADQAAAYESVAVEVAESVDDTEEVTETEIVAEEVAEIVAEEVAETVAEEVAETVAGEVTETVADEAAEKEIVTVKEAETVEVAKRKGSPLLNAAKHRRFANITIRKKKKRVFISRSGAVGVLVPSPQKTEDAQEEDDDDKEDDIKQKCRKLLNDLGLCGRAYSSAAMDLATERTSAEEDVK